MTPIRDTSLPRPALVLGALGVLPFIVLATQTATNLPLGSGYTDTARQALLVYGAVILSFLGGVQWGLAVATADRSDAWRRYGLSVLPSLLAFAGFWLGGRNGLIALASGLSVWCIYELWATGLGEAPPWYGRLRFGLSVVAVACLVAAVAYGPH